MPIKQPPQTITDKPQVSTGRSDHKKKPYFLQAATNFDVHTIFFSPEDLTALLKGWGFAKK